MDTLYINGTDVLTLGASGMLTYTVSGSNLTNDWFLGRFRTHMSMYLSIQATRTLTLTLLYEGADRGEVTLAKSKVDSALTGSVELSLPDGFEYTAVCSSFGEMELIGAYPHTAGRAVYTFDAICHGEQITEAVPVGGSLTCTSTMPRTDCILEVTSSSAHNVYILGTVRFLNIAAGDVLTADGINGRFLVNGAPAANRIIFTEFPYLVPGSNSFPDATDPVTVTYYPTYI